MAENRKIAWSTKAAPYVTTALALEIVGLFGFAYLTDSHLPGISPLAATSIFIDGTKDILPTDDSQAADRMRDTLSGKYDQCGASSTGDCAGNIHVAYSRDFGILTQGDGYNTSKAEARDNTIAAIRTAQLQNPGQPVYVVGYSQGANASSDVIKKAAELNSNGATNTADDLDLSNVTFVMVGNGARNSGGLWASLPPGVYVPFLGLSFGASTNPVVPSTGPNAPKQIILISKQYDGASDVPRFILNPIADMNAIMGFFSVHNGYYQDVNIDDLDSNQDKFLSPEEIQFAQTDPTLSKKYIITKNGNVVDVVVRNEPGDLPITEPLKALGVPEDFIKAIDPILRAMIEAGYERPTNGEYPAEPVHFKIFPKPNKLFQDFLAIAAGAEQTGENLDDLDSANTLQLASEPVVGNSLARQGATVPAAAPPPSAPKPTFKEEWKLPAVLQQSAPQFTQWQAPPPPPPVKELLPPVEAVPLAPADPFILDPDSLGNGAASPSGSAGTTAGTGLKNLQAGVKKLVDGVVKILTPPKAATTPETVSTPEPTGPDPGAGAETNTEGAGTS